jgi:hypothetical protein
MQKHILRSRRQYLSGDAGFRWRALDLAAGGQNDQETQHMTQDIGSGAFVAWRSPDAANWGIDGTIANGATIDVLPAGPRVKASLPCHFGGRARGCLGSPCTRAPSFRAAFRISGLLRCCDYVVPLLTDGAPNPTIVSIGDVAVRPDPSGRRGNSLPLPTRRRSGSRIGSGRNL